MLKNILEVFQVSSLTLILTALPYYANAELKVICVGDSIVAKAPEVSQPNQFGWGETLSLFLDPEIEIINLAAGGRSSKSFIDEGRWVQAKHLQGDFYFIEFGHNDQKSFNPSVYTDPETSYKDYLRRYINEARQLGAEPILITPLARRVFHSNGSINQSLLPYAHAMKAVSEEETVLCIDMFSISKDYYEFIGESESLAYGDTESDRSHFSLLGAQWCARLIIHYLVQSKHPSIQLLASKAHDTVPILKTTSPVSENASFQVSTDLENWKSYGEEFPHTGGERSFSLWIEHSPRAYVRIQN